MKNQPYLALSLVPIHPVALLKSLVLLSLIQVLETQKQFPYSNCSLNASLYKIQAWIVNLQILTLLFVS